MTIEIQRSHFLFGKDLVASGSLLYINMLLSILSYLWFQPYPLPSQNTGDKGPNNHKRPTTQNHPTEITTTSPQNVFIRSHTSSPLRSSWRADVSFPAGLRSCLEHGFGGAGPQWPHTKTLSGVHHRNEPGVGAERAERAGAGCGVPELNM